MISIQQETADALRSLITISGASISDLAYKYCASPRAVLQRLEELGIAAPTMGMVDGPNAFVQTMLGVIRDAAPGNSFILDHNDKVWGLPNSVHLSNIDIVQVYEHIHGKGNFMDQYNGVAGNSSQLFPVDGNYRNFLATNIEALSAQTIAERYNHHLNPQLETFVFEFGSYRVRLHILKRYDAMVGGTYNPEYIQGLFKVWVAYPLVQYGVREPEREAVIEHKSPMALAWWAWNQLTHYGLLKGLHQLDVEIDKDTSSWSINDKVRGTPLTMTTMATVSAQDVLSSITVYLERNNSRIIIGATQPPKFDPSIALRG